MKIVETIFLVLTFLMPTLFLALMLSDVKKVKKNRKYRERLLKLTVLSLVVNFLIFGALKIYNTKADKKDYDTENKTNDINKDDVPTSATTTTSPTSTNTPSTTPTTTSTTTTKKVDQGSTTVSGGTTSKGYKIEVKDGVTYIDGFLVVNKTYPLPSSYVPTGTHKKVSGQICQECIIEEGYSAFANMKKDATAQGLNLWIQSGYRSYSYQGGLYNGYVKRSGKEAADTFSARPGHSEHQSGYAFDLNTITDAFANTKEGKWVNENCYKYGFIIRYPKGKENETGYKYESWHLRYVGVDLASKLYNAGDWITMEDHFGITSQYKD